MKKKVFVFILSAFFVCSSFAGPFGFNRGMSVEEMELNCRKKMILIKDDLYRIFPKKRYENLDKYYARVDKDLGLYSLMIDTSSIKFKKNGEAIKSRFNTIVENLETVYGRGEIIDYKKKGAFWKKERDWMLGSLNKQSKLSSTWSAETGQKLPPEITYISVDVSSKTKKKGFISLYYLFSNFSDVDTKQKERDRNKYFDIF
ncbi:MAG: hypothetical protein ACRC4W_06585 [Treponemataceae bacterium]